MMNNENNKEILNVVENQESTTLTLEQQTKEAEKNEKYYITYIAWCQESVWESSYINLGRYVSICK